jgi:hypothetical protein
MDSSRGLEVFGMGSSGGTLMTLVKVSPALTSEIMSCMSSTYGNMVVVTILKFDPRHCPRQVQAGASLREI